MILTILYWVFLALMLFGLAPDSWPNGRRIGWGGALILFIIIGLRLFRTSLN